MKKHMKACIDQIQIPHREKEEIFFRLMDGKTEKRYRNLQKKFALVTSVLVLFLAVTNWEQIYTAASDLRKKVTVYEWEGAGTEEASGIRQTVLGEAILETKEYLIPERMEKLPCNTVEVQWKNGHCRIDYHTGEYHYLEKSYADVSKLEKELGVSVWTPFAGEKEGQGVRLTICEDALLKPAVITMRYLLEETQGLICTLRITAYGGEVPEGSEEGKLTMGESFEEKYQAKSGLEAYIYYNRYNQNSPEDYFIYNNDLVNEDGEKELHYEYWEAVTPFMVSSKSYEAMFYKDGMRYEISGAQTLREMRKILDSFQE